MAASDWSKRAVRALAACARAELDPWHCYGLALALPLLMTLLVGADAAAHSLAASLIVAVCAFAGGWGPALVACAVAVSAGYASQSALGLEPLSLRAELMFFSQVAFSTWLGAGLRQATLAYRSMPREPTQDVFSDVFDNVPLALMIVRLSDGSLVAVNSAFSDLWGYTRAQALGRSSAQLSLWVEAEQLIQKLKANCHSDTQELQIRTVVGEIRDVLASVRLIHFRDAAHLLVAAADVTERKRTAELEHLANHDVLTSLPNRLLLESRLHRTSAGAAQGELGAVLCVDLDGFKHVNDSLGHAAGDELLRLAALRMKSRTRGGDTLARVGGDEFVVLLESLTKRSEAEAVAEDLLACLSQPFVLGQGTEVHISASIGIASFDPRVPDAAAHACHQADAALYAAKRAGRNAVRVFWTEPRASLSGMESDTEEPASGCATVPMQGEAGAEILARPGNGSLACESAGSPQQSLGPTT